MNKPFLVVENGYKSISYTKIQVFIYEYLKGNLATKKEIISFILGMYKEHIDFDPDNASRLCRVISNSINKLKDNGKIELVDINNSGAIPKFRYQIRL